MDDKAPRKSRSLARRLLRLVVVMLILGVAAVGALPWLLALPPGRALVVSLVNKSIAPSRVDLTGLSPSWAGSIRVSGLVLKDKAGKTLLAARRAVLDRGLISLALDHTRLGTLTVDGAAIDVERRADGSIDLVEALSPPKPAAAPTTAAPAPEAAATPIDVTVRVVGGTVRFATPELAEPFTAGQVDVELRMPAHAEQKMTWKVRLAQPEGGTASEALGIDGEFDHHATIGEPDLSLTVKGSRWPLALAHAGTVARAKLDGSLTARREHGHWSSSGDAKLLGLDASGPALSGDRLALDEVAAAWELAQKDGAWSISTLSLNTPVGSIAANGALAATAEGETIARDSRLEGRIDLAALARQIPHTLHLKEGLTLDRGSARVLVQFTPKGEEQRASVEMSLSDLIAREAVAGQPARMITLKDPARVNAKGMRSPSGFSLEVLEVKTPFLTLAGSGDLKKGVNLTGTVDLARIEEQFRDLIDFGSLQLKGQGRMAASYTRSGEARFLGRYALEVTGLNVVGLTDAPIVRDKLRFDAAGTGPGDASGLPASWDNVRINLKSSQDSVALAATTRKAVTSLNLAASLPLTVSTRDGQADVKLVGRWRGGVAGLSPTGVVDVDELRLGLRPLDARLAAAGTLAFAAKGWVDLDDDGLQLTPLPCPAPLVLAPEGLKLHGLRKTPVPQRAGKVALIGDVAAIERALFVWTGREPSGLDGALATELGMGPGEKDTLNLGLNVSVPDLSRLAADGKGRTPEGPLGVAFGGNYDPAADRLAVNSLLILNRYARLDGKGAIDDPRGKRLADLQGTLAPNWVALSALVAGSTEPNAKLQGTDRAFRLKGPLSGGSLAAILKGLDAELGINLASADVMGLNLGPAPLVVRCKGGTFAVDPIRTTLNNGAVDLRPGLTVDEAQGIAVTLAQGSKIAGAEVNDEVSKDLLSFIAPVLDKATNVHGKINMNVDRADIPLTGPPTRRLSMNGTLDFQDVVFAPGPFAEQMLTLVGKKNEPGLKLKQPLELSVVDGRVFQKGLKVPIGPNATITLAGSVGFDESLDLKAGVPITKGMLGAAGGLGLDQLVSNNTITVPIAGTISHPQVNRQALQVALRELSKNVLKKDLSSQAEKLLDRLGPAPAAGNPGGGGGGNGGIPNNLRGLENQLLRRLQPRADNPPN